MQFLIRCNYDLKCVIFEGNSFFLNAIEFWKNKNNENNHENIVIKFFFKNPSLKFE